MKKLIVLSAGLFLFALACNTSYDKHAGNENLLYPARFEKPGFSSSDELPVFTASIKNTNSELFVFESANVKSYKNLTIIPVFATEEFTNMHRFLGDYLNLKEALEAGILKITENTRDGYEQVNFLTVQNISKSDTVFLMGGDVVQGGKQDRIVAKDALIPPLSGLLKIDVYCVEHGRWTYHSQNRGSMDFKFSGEIAGKSVRKESYKAGNQGKVWEKVEEVTMKNSASSGTGTYNALKGSKEFTDSKTDYLKYFENLFDKTSGIIGVVAFSGDSLIGCDLFYRDILFKKQYKVLIHSYITEAITYGSDILMDVASIQNHLNLIYKSYFGDAQTKSSDVIRFKHNGLIIHYAYI